MIKGLPDQERYWLKQFFSGRNELCWEDIVGGKAPAAWLEQVSPWVSTFISRDGQVPIVLPVFDSQGPCSWYAMANSETSATALAQELTAVVGPSYSDFRGYTVQFDNNDEIESALRERFGRFIFRLKPVSTETRNDIAQALHLYLGVLRRRPDISDRTQRPFGKIRSEFDCALLVGNEADSLRLRDEMITSGRIDAEQQKYLEIRLLAGLGRHHQLAHDYPLIKSILGLSLPAQTIVDLVEALYATYIATIEEETNVDVILEAFRNDIVRSFGSLFSKRKGIRHPNVLKAFLLYELTQSEPNLTRCEAIAAAYPTSAGRELIDRWLSRLVSSPPPRADAFELARQALFDDDYEMALQLAFEANPEVQTYRIMLRCAVELKDYQVTQRVLEVVGTVPEVVRASWTKHDLTRLQQLQSEPSGSIEMALAPKTRPETDWVSWANYVEAGNFQQPPLQILNDAVTSWSVEIYASDPDICRKLADKIGNANGVAEQVFRDAFAVLVEFFVERQAQPVRGFIPLYIMLIRIVAWSGVVSGSELELSTLLMQALISLGPSRSEYLEAIDSYNEIVTANSAPSNVDWALNAAELLAIHSAPENESRLRFFMAVVELARTHAHRLNLAQHAILSLLAKDYDCENLLESFPVKTEDSAAKISYAAFAGLIGIYTLTESAGLRAAQTLLRDFVPMSRVEVNADMVATDKLKNLAETADIFVFAWKSSKHQAYYAAKEARGTLKMLLPPGKGSASIINSVLGEIGICLQE